jgi:hypothetical protein
MTPPPPNAAVWWANRRKQAYICLAVLVVQLFLINLLIWYRVPLDAELKGVLVWINSMMGLVILAYHGGSLTADWLASRKT